MLSLSAVLKLTFTW